MRAVIAFFLFTVLLIGCGPGEPTGPTTVKEGEGPNVELLMKNLDSDTPKVRQTAIAVLSVTGQPAVDAGALEKFKEIQENDPDPGTREKAAEGIARLEKLSGTATAE